MDKVAHGHLRYEKKPDRPPSPPPDRFCKKSLFDGVPKITQKKVDGTLIRVGDLYLATFRSSVTGQSKDLMLAKEVDGEIRLCFAKLNESRDGLLPGKGSYRLCAFAKVEHMALLS